MSRAVLITGASSGIGAATARLAARDGWNVGVHYRSDREGAEAVARDVEAMGRTAVPMQGDMANPDDIAALFATFDAAFGRIDGLVNNAGIVDVTSRVDAFGHDRLRRLFDINVIGPILVAGEAVRRMSTAKGGQGGAIVNVSSVAARLGAAGQYVDYAATKGAIDTFTKGLALEVAGEGIRVTGVRPGLVETPIHAKGGLPDRARTLAPTVVSLKRAAEAEEIAEAIVWLLSDKSSYVIGTMLDVDGGR